MKKFKVSLYAVAAIIIAATSAFTTKADLKKKENVFYYRFTETTSANLLDESKWQNVDGLAEGCSSFKDLNCTIEVEQAPNQSGHPTDFSAVGITSTGDLDAVTDNWKESD